MIRLWPFFDKRLLTFEMFGTPMRKIVEDEYLFISNEIINMIGKIEFLLDRDSTKLVSNYIYF